MIPRVMEAALLKAAADRPLIAGNDHRFSFVGHARVHRPFKSSRNVPVAKLVMPQTSCDHPPGVGTSGIVAGTLQCRNEGSIELLAIPEWFGEPVGRTPARSKQATRIQGHSQ